MVIILTRNEFIKCKLFTSFSSISIQTAVSYEVAGLQLPVKYPQLPAIVMGQIGIRTWLIYPVYVES